MTVGSITTNDGVKIAYEKEGETGPSLVLIHGWAGSRRSFDLVAQDLATAAQVYRLDLRFHGDSDKPEWGYHVARLAADVRDFLEALDISDVVLVGASFGASVIWCYFELFGQSRVSKAVFVDQGPLLIRTEDWGEDKACKGMYSAEKLGALDTLLKTDQLKFAKLNVPKCSKLPIDSAVLAIIEEQTMKCKPDSLVKIQADHMQLDWRPVLPRIQVECLNIISQNSNVFPVEGVTTVTKLIPSCKEVIFQESGHWVQLEEPSKFSGLVKEFIKEGNKGRPDSSTV